MRGGAGDTAATGCIDRKTLHSHSTTPMMAEGHPEEWPNLLFYWCRQPESNW